MKKLCCWMLALTLALLPCAAGASWYGGGSSSLDELLGMLGGSEWSGEEDSTHDDSAWQSDVSGLNDILDMFGSSDWTGGENASSYGWSEDDSSSYGSILDILGGYGWESETDEEDAYSSYGSSSSGLDSLLEMFGGMGYGSSYNSYGSYDDYSSYDSYGGYGSLSGWDSLSSLFAGSTFGGSTGNYTATDNGSASDWTDTGSKKDTWAIYWYLCGSDLETNSGCATADLVEMMEANLPDNVSVVIQTGGARRWQNNYVKSDRLQRWLYQNGELRLIGEERNASMGNPETLASFLDFCDRQFPADKRAVVFWNHGGGSVAGAAYDENYSYDALSLSEMYTAFTAVFNQNEKNPPLEMVGFDTCLMATIDVAHIFRGLASYLVASEETEPGSGWDYQAWMQQLGQNPAMSGAQLGRIICDTYAQRSKAQNMHGSITLSVTDLSRVGGLVEAYEDFGVEALKAATADSGFFNRFARAVARSENYGGNSREQGYTNMVDLGHLARLTSDLLPSAQQVLNELDECVLYRINGSHRAEATGLSCYYSYSGNIHELNTYLQEGVGDAFACYNLYGLTGKLNDAGMAYLQQEDEEPPKPQELAIPQSLAEAGWDNMPVTVDEDGVSCLNLGPQADDLLASVGFQLYFIDAESDLMMWLGSDNDVEGSWEDGVFYDNFRGVWGGLNDHLVFMELTFEGEDYNLYSVPILLNDEPCHLEVAYDFIAEEWSILGARRGLEENGMSYRDVRLLREGDVITTLWYLSEWSDEDSEFEAVEVDEITIRDQLVFDEMPLPDGMYAMMFEMKDAQGNCAYSEAVTFECDGGDIYTYLDS